MASVETRVDALLVGLGPEAETQLPAAWLKRRRQAQDALAIALLVAIQVAWVGLLLLAAYFFIAR